jgi:DNA-binding transcriptional MerR regulator
MKEEEWMQKRPIDIARKLKISTSALRHYESRGLVPQVQRSASGYRMYTEDHIAYFEYVHAMTPGFGMDVTSEVLRNIQKRDTITAFLLINQSQAKLYQDRIISEKLIDTLASQKWDRSDENKEKEWLTIGEVSAETHIPSSAIRHWKRLTLLHQIGIKPITIASSIVLIYGKFC